jgi:hypothetical protein
VLLLTSALLGCGAAARGPPTPADPLDQAAVDVLAREACPRVLARTFPLEDERRTATTGELWVRRCTARGAGRELTVDIDVLGWQWVSAGSWGFDVHEYVYFRASVRATVRVSVASVAGRATLHARAATAPDVDVHELGRVSTRAQGPAAGLLGVAMRILGEGPTTLATSALRARVAELIRTQATGGLEIALGEVPSPGADEAARDDLLRETQGLSPGGALISGSYPAGVPTSLRFEVGGTGVALARAVCLETALPMVDAVVGGSPVPAPPPATGVIVLQGRGEVPLEPQPCPWVLVTGVSSDAPVTAALELRRGQPSPAHVAERWVRVTLLAYGIDRPGSQLLAFQVRGDRAPSSFGRPLTRGESPAVWLVADPIEVMNGTPVVVEVRAEKPRAPSLWSARLAYDELLLGSARIVPEGRTLHEERRAELEGGNGRVGWVSVAFDAVDVQ